MEMKTRIKELYHYGTPEHSGRYRWGSGDRPYQRLEDGHSRSRTSKTALDNVKTSKSNKPKSNHRRELELRYRQKGMSRYQAQKAADNRIRTEKIVLGVAGAVAITAIAAYGYSKYSNYVTDKVLPAGTKLQRMQLASDQNVALNERNFYVSYLKGDKTLYGTYARQLSNRGANAVDKLLISKDKDLVIASEQTTRRTFEELFDSSSEFRDSLIKSIKVGAENSKTGHRLNPKQQAAYDSILKLGSSNKKLDMRKAYDAFNINIVKDHGEHSERALELFVNELKKKGYGAIGDINDMRYSTYHATHPLIVFKDEGSTYSIITSRISPEKVAKVTAKGYAKWTLNNTVRNVAPKGAFVTGIGAGAAVGKNKYIADRYKKKHPNTWLTDSQIVRKRKKKGA